MMENSCLRRVLCIRADNMGDVIMSSPAMRALKETFGSQITLLTSRAGALVVPYLDCVDGLITADLPWAGHATAVDYDLPALAGEIASMHFDAAIIFTVYSQSALPAALLAYMAGIPVRVAYARENPYALLTNWLPDHEPYERIGHQVERDLHLVRSIGADVADDRLFLTRHAQALEGLKDKLSSISIHYNTSYWVLHPGVSEEKRKYPAELWIETGKLLRAKLGLPLLISGSASEKTLADAIAAGIGSGARSVAGALSLGEFIALVDNATGVISVNTSTIHIAAAVHTPVVVLYAQTNPQHTPWKCLHEVLPFSVPAHLQSRNAIIRHVAESLYHEVVPYPAPAEIAGAMERLLSSKAAHPGLVEQERY
ncbi:ADP-heptose:LPS heptosyltransferase [Dyadobacter sp. BE34]|uniref:ADP-heptose:LPS heptosyltransferase n=1 Tax=Dyadobacter fermentans TaxID=94254 RepID=A0ABU1QUT0_9BACT|nr:MULTISPECIES: glycosyltransferase family 9 protein [Dyadobacter]MDR6804515.1 ADP-heptose:LPS heptosyltransferase [Dyadobacter fermentans]MDR7042255.1 ADP-heptose:LPS heptosyltransferase [Dyadobacter sp. BE242]MDR7196658.1 ADP-heptose:LPS heptosyltransferase [Dyadobacter sp. BE34]MDR7212797.1 ADP-heptose:LPS heptosyltransferase [Dyadobacter sp. BE31]MDR7262064.1 ADP-heptose:LPS heptosyltransferase [Dyadobacter sp. BE32]